MEDRRERDGEVFVRVTIGRDRGTEGYNVEKTHRLTAGRMIYQPARTYLAAGSGLEYAGLKEFLSAGTRALEIAAELDALHRKGSEYKP